MNECEWTRGAGQKYFPLEMSCQIKPSRKIIIIGGSAAVSLTRTNLNAFHKINFLQNTFFGIVLDMLTNNRHFIGHPPNTHFLTNFVWTTTHLSQLHDSYQLRRVTTKMLPQRHMTPVNLIFSNCFSCRITEQHKTLRGKRCPLDRKERVCHPSHPDGMTNFALLAPSHQWLWLSWD